MRGLSEEEREEPLVAQERNGSSTRRRPVGTPRSGWLRPRGNTVRRSAEAAAWNAKTAINPMRAFNGLYRFNVSTPCAPINPILLGRVHRRASRGRSGGCSEVEGTVWSRSSGRVKKGTRLRRGLESGGVAPVVPRAARRRGGVDLAKARGKTQRSTPVKKPLLLYLS